MKDKFIELLRSTKREGIENLISFLEKTDFFTAPASTRFHGSYEGGLLEHSMKVYEILNYKLKNNVIDLFVPEDTIIIVALLHDICKANFYKVDIQNIIVIYDDMDIEVGAIKLRKKGGPGSHNGMKSVVEELNSTDFPRVRVGIGKPEFKNDTINYVIGKMPEEEFEKLDKSTQIAADAVVEIVKNGIDTAMNKYN